jgi:hypothetical protein
MIRLAARLKAPAASRTGVAPSDDEMPLAGSAPELPEQVKRHGNCQFGARRGTFPSSARQEPSGANVGLLSPCVVREDRLGAEPSMLLPFIALAGSFDRRLERCPMAGDDEPGDLEHTRPVAVER